MRRILVLIVALAAIAGCSHNPYIRARQIEAGAVGGLIGFAAANAARPATPYYGYGIGPRLVHTPCGLLPVELVHTCAQPPTVIIIERR